MSSSGRSSPQSPSTRRLSSNRRRKGKKKKKAKLKLPKINTEDEKMLAHFKKFWYDSLTSKPSKEEMFQIPGYSFDSARKVIDVDSYEARGLKKSFGDSIAQLFQAFIKHKGRNMIQSFQIGLSKALYSNVKKAEKVIDKFEKVYKYIETNDFNIPPQSVQNKNKQRRDKTSQDKSQSKTGLTSDGEDAKVDEIPVKALDFSDFRNEINLTSSAKTR